MIRKILRKFGCFGRDDSGSATIEFAITFPAFLVVLLSGFELGMVSLQHASLERAMDQTVRDIRISTGSAPQHDEIKQLICLRAGYIRNCEEAVLLEMVQVDPRAWANVTRQATCVDKSEEVKPKTTFKNDAQGNDLMILRACAKIDPVFPTTGLGKNLVKDGAGQFAIVATTAFVQEPT